MYTHNRLTGTDSMAQTCKLEIGQTLLHQQSGGCWRGAHVAYGKLAQNLHHKIVKICHMKQAQSPKGDVYMISSAHIWRKKNHAYNHQSLCNCKQK